MGLLSKIRSRLSGGSKFVRAVRKNGEVVMYPNCGIHRDGRYVVLTRRCGVHAVLVMDYFERVEKKKRINITQSDIRAGGF